MSIRLCVVCFYPNIAFGRVRVSAARKHWTGTMYITVLFFCSEALMLLELRRRCMLFLGKWMPLKRIAVYVCLPCKKLRANLIVRDWKKKPTVCRQLKLLSLIFLSRWGSHLNCWKKFKNLNCFSNSILNDKRNWRLIEIKYGHFPFPTSKKGTRTTTFCLLGKVRLHRYICLRGHLSWSLEKAWSQIWTMVTMVTIGGDLQPGCLADRLLTGLGQPQINP